MTLTPESITAVYRDLHDATTAAAEARADLTFAERNLLNARSVIVLAHPDPKELGANEALRDARVAHMTTMETIERDNALAESKAADLALELAGIAEREMRALLRLAEIENGRRDDG